MAYRNQDNQHALVKATADRVRNLLARNKGAIELAMPKGFNYERFSRVVVSAIMTTPKLAQCTPASLFIESVKAFAMGLEPNGVLGHGYLVPYGRVAKFMPSYRGLTDLAHRSGKVAFVCARAHHENDHFELRYGTEQVIIHRPNLADPGPVLGYYAVVRFKDGSVDFEYMSMAGIDAIRKRSKAADSGPWITDPGEMAKKTVLRRLLKRVPMSVEVGVAVAQDTAVATGEETPLVTAETGLTIDIEALDIPEEARSGAGTADAVAKESMDKVKAGVAAKKRGRAVPGAKTANTVADAPPDARMVGLLVTAKVPADLATDYLRAIKKLGPAETVFQADSVTREYIANDPERFGHMVREWFDNLELEG